MIHYTEEVDETEKTLFKKKIKQLKKYKGKGTQLISLYVPFGTDRSIVMSQLTEEISQSSNIKSPQTRKNVQGALRRITTFLKHIEFKIPSRGLVVFSGNISEQDGRQDIQLFTIHPIKPLKTKLYWCDSDFHLAPLEEMIEPSDIYAVLTIDKNEATLATILGKSYEIVGHFTSGFSGKIRAGGQSAKRFEHLREEAVQQFFKRSSEKVNNTLVPHIEKLKGIIIAGPGMTKNYFLNHEYLDHRIRQKIIGILDTSYTDESGIREVLQKSDTILKDHDLIKEQKTIDDFFREIVKTGLGIYGRKEVEDALNIGKVKTLLISEDLEFKIYKLKCTQCEKEEILSKPIDEEFSLASYKCSSCSSSQVELLEEADYLDYLTDIAKNMSTEVKVISTTTPEGKQFFDGFGGIGAVLRYK